jgi:hypothetical protein
MSSHSVNPVVYVTLCIIALGAFVAVAYLGRSTGAALAPAATPNSVAFSATLRAAAIEPAQPESVPSRIRRALVWLDTVTTPQGAFFWPTGNVCGPPRERRFRR